MNIFSLNNLLEHENTGKLATKIQSLPLFYSKEN